MDTNTVQVINAFGDKMDQYLTVLADKAGVAADHFYPIFVRQQAIEGWVMLTMLAAVVIAMVIFANITRNQYKKMNENNRYNSDLGIPSCVLTGAATFLLAIVLLCAGGSEGIDSFGKILNPEYYAVKSLVKMVK